MRLQYTARVHSLCCTNNTGLLRCMLTQASTRNISFISIKGKQISHFPIVFEQLKRDFSHLQKLTYVNASEEANCWEVSVHYLYVCAGVCEVCDDSMHVLLPSLFVCRCNKPACTLKPHVLTTGPMKQSGIAKSTHATNAQKSHELHIFII